jgi:hypothetical protein
MFRTRLLALTAAGLLPAASIAQPSLDSLWPNPDGLRWDYVLTSVSTIIPEDNFAVPAFMQLAGTAETAGGTAQVLLAQHELPPNGSLAAIPVSDPLLRAVWRARPDLRPALAAAASRPGPVVGWYPLLLSWGLFMKRAENIQMWQEIWDHPTWTYLTDDLALGASFTHQLIPELAADVFLHGTVEATDATVTTAAGVFEHAVRMGYVIDYGWSALVDEQQNEIGTYRAETRGHVAYVPDVGPVDLHEDFIPLVEVDCGANPCPTEITDQVGDTVQTFTLDLTSLPVGVERSSWAQVKILYRAAGR